MGTGKERNSPEILLSDDISALASLLAGLSALDNQLIELEELGDYCLSLIYVSLCPSLCTLALHPPSTSFPAHLFVSTRSRIHYLHPQLSQIRDHNQSFSMTSEHTFNICNSFNPS